MAKDDLDLYDRYSKQVNGTETPGIGSVQSPYMRTELNQSESKESELLNRLLTTSNKLKEVAAKTVVHSSPLITLKNVGIIRRNTIVLLQGKYGSHKSRLGELFMSLFLASTNNLYKYLGFAKPNMERFAVAFLDSERNTTEELPDAIQRIREHAGYKKYEDIPNFFFTSIKDLDRKSRLAAVETYLTYVRSQTDLHLIVFIDVATDAVKSFNDDVEAMAFYDFIGRMCDRHNCTIFLVIHENPGGIESKARGHIGTEGTNKASTVLSISIVKNGDERTDLIRLRFQKLRAQPMPDIFAEFDEATRSLKLASPEKITSLKDASGKLPIDELIEYLPEILTEPMEATPLHLAIMERFKIGSKNTVIPVLDKIVSDEKILSCTDIGDCLLISNKVGTKKIYSLISISI